MDALSVIYLIISLIVLTCFFVLCANVATIKRNTPRNNPDYWERQYFKHSSCHRDELALYALQEFIYLSVRSADVEGQKRIYKVMFDRYGETIKAYGAKFMQPV